MTKEKMPTGNVITSNHSPIRDPLLAGSCPLCKLHGCDATLGVNNLWKGKKE